MIGTIRGFTKFLAQDHLIHTIGNEGSGPGEFEYLAGVYVGEGDTVYAMDGRLERICKYAPPIMNSSI